MKNWDLRAGFTKDYDLANSAVREADKQFEAAQGIVKSAYALDRTAATQGGEIERMNQENLEKLLLSQEKVGDFQSQQEIQRALESMGDPFVENPEDAQPVQPDRRIVTEEGKVMDDPTAPVDVVKNAEKPPAPVAQRRPMTAIERLKAIEPMITSPRAKLALRQRIQTAATEEARQLATIAPDEAFNGLIKNGVIRGNPLVANDDGTFTRVMPDGKNQIRLDRNEAAAWVGDVISKTNEQYKLLEKRRDIGERASSEIFVDKEKSQNRMLVDENEARLRLITQAQRAGFDDRNVRLRASVGQYSGGGGGLGGVAGDGVNINTVPLASVISNQSQQRSEIPSASEQQAPIGPGPATTQRAPNKENYADLVKELKDANESLAKAKNQGNPARIRQSQNAVRILEDKLGGRDQNKTAVDQVFDAYLSEIPVSMTQPYNEQNWNPQVDIRKSRARAQIKRIQQDYIDKAKGDTLTQRDEKEIETRVAKVMRSLEAELEKLKAKK